MKKYVCAAVAAVCVLGIYFRFSGSSSAPTAQEFYEVPAAVLEHLEKCNPYTGNFEAYVGESAQMTYFVAEQPDGMCVFDIQAETPFMVLDSHCLFDADDRKKYVGLLQKLKKKKNGRSLARNPRYQELLDFTLSRCQINRQPMDFTAEFREHLQTCSPYEQEQKILHGYVIRRIYGKDDDGRCVVGYGQGDVWWSSERGWIVPLAFQCAFSDEQKTDYMRILEGKIIAGGDIRDDVDMSALNLEHEVEFFAGICGTAISPGRLQE